MCRAISKAVRTIAGLVLAGAVGVGCVSDKAVISQAADAHKTLAPAVITDAELQAYIQKVGDRVVMSARELIQEGYYKDRIYDEDPSWMFEEVQFHLVNSDTLNAFTTGGQHIYLYSELFRTAKTEDEFAAVVAHEFAHIVGRHVARGMGRQYAIVGLAAGAAVGGYAIGGDDRETYALGAGAAALMAGQFVGMGFTRKDETEADKFGFQFYCNAGWDPDRFGDFFQQMIDKGYDTTPELASDHPTLRSRVADAKEWAEEWKQEHPNWKSYIKPDVVTPNRFRQLQEKARALGKSLPNDASLKAALMALDAFPSCVAPVDQPRQVEARAEISEAAKRAERNRR
jgi:predicted Zn-dependent protease